MVIEGGVHGSGQGMLTGDGILDLAGLKWS